MGANKPLKIVNLTPHAITIPATARPERGEWTLPPSGRIARVAEAVTDAAPIGDIPTTRVRYGAVEDLPEPEWRVLPNPCDAPSAVPEGSRFCLACGATDGHVPGAPREPAIYYVVSTIAADAARRFGRTTEDLLTPGQPIRDSAGRVVGCLSLVRIG
jgi:hypothetical protein